MSVRLTYAGAAAVLAIAMVAIFQNCSNAPASFSASGSATSASQVLGPPTDLVPLAFADVSGVEPSRLVTSEAVAVDGFQGERPASCPANASNCALDVNQSGQFLASVPGVRAGDRIRLQVLSSPSSGGVVSASVLIGDTPSRVWTVTTRAIGGCVANAGQSCSSGFRGVEGCQPGYICASYWGVWYSSTAGCTPETGSASSSDPPPTALGGYVTYVQPPGGRPSCTYLGAGSGDPFRAVPNGQCQLSTAYTSPNTYVKVVPWNGQGPGCLSQVETTGAVQCDGSCR